MVPKFFRERNGGGDQDDTTDDGDMGSGLKEHTESNGTSLLSDRERRVSGIQFFLYCIVSMH